MHIRIYYLSSEMPANWGDGAPLNNIEVTLQNAINDGLTCPDVNYVDAWWWQWSPDSPIVATTDVADGGIIFVDVDREVALSVLSPSQVSASKIASVIKMLCKVEYDGDSGYVNADGSAWGFGNGQGNECIFAQLPILGDSLNFLCDLEKYIMLALSGFFTFRAIDSNNQNGKAAWGTAAAVVGYKAAQGFKLLP